MNSDAVKCASCENTLPKLAQVTYQGDNGRVCADCYTDQVLELVAKQREIDDMLAQSPEYVWCYYCMGSIIDQRNYPDFKRTNTETACRECKERIY